MWPFSEATATVNGGFSASRVRKNRIAGSSDWNGRRLATTWSDASPALAATYKIDGMHSSAVYKIMHFNTSNFYGTFGSVEGTITTEERGEGGFGYDPVFEVDGATLAEHGVEFKNRMSHRARALRALAEELSGAELP